MAKATEKWVTIRQSASYWWSIDRQFQDVVDKTSAKLILMLNVT
jgi:hypothetical protein